MLAFVTFTMFIHMYTIARKLEGFRGVLLICQHEMKFIKYVSNVAVTNDLLSNKRKEKNIACHIYTL